MLATPQVLDALQDRQETDNLGFGYAKIRTHDTVPPKDAKTRMLEDPDARPLALVYVSSEMRKRGGVFVALSSAATGALALESIVKRGKVELCSAM